MKINELEKEKIETKQYIDEIDDTKFVKNIKKIIKSYNRYKKRNA